MPLPVRMSPQLGRLDRLGAHEVLRMGDLDVGGLALEHGDLHAGPFGERGVVGEVGTALAGGAAVRFDQGGEGEGLRRLDRSELRTVERLADESITAHDLDCIRDR